MACSRCTKEHQVLLEIEVREECALEEIDEPAAYQVGAFEGSPIPILNGSELDLSELIREQLNLHLPARSLCKADCAGICPGCGQDLNDGSCECNDEVGDARLAGLGDLFAGAED